MRRDLPENFEVGEAPVGSIGFAAAAIATPLGGGSGALVPSGLFRAAWSAAAVLVMTILAGASGDIACPQRQQGCFARQKPPSFGRFRGLAATRARHYGDRVPAVVRPLAGLGGLAHRFLGISSFDQHMTGNIAQGAVRPRREFT